LTVVVVDGQTLTVAIELLTRQERRLKPELQHRREIGNERKRLGTSGLRIRV